MNFGVGNFELKREKATTSKHALVLSFIAVFLCNRAENRNDSHHW